MSAPPRRVLVCPQEFKGSLDPFAAAAAIAHGVRAALPSAEVIERPLADGGPGTAAIIAAATGASMVRVAVTGAYGASVDAEYARLDDLAVIEAARVVGLTMTPAGGRRPAHSTTAGLGELILHAVEAGAKRVIIGVGGTATCDGGAGVARALGLRLLDARGDTLPPGPMHLARLARVAREDDVQRALSGIDVRVAVDVQNPLTGPQGAAAIFGAQKGLRDWEAPALDRALRRWAERVRLDLACEVDAVPGAGAGGGIPAGILAAIPGARIESGAALVAEAVGLGDLVSSVDLVVTGEGALDAQTAYGKTVAHVTALCRSDGVPCLAVAGIVEAVPAGIADAEPLAATAEDVEAAQRDAAARCEASSKRLIERWTSRAGA